MDCVTELSVGAKGHRRASCLCCLPAIKDVMKRFGKVALGFLCRICFVFCFVFCC